MVTFSFHMNDMAHDHLLYVLSGEKNRLLTFLQALFVDCQGTLLSLLAFPGLDACVLPCAET